MKKKALLMGIVLITLLSLLSCELFLEKPPKPTINALFISLDYHETTLVTINSITYSLPYLPGVIPDIEEVSVALNLLSDENHFDMEINNVMMIEKNGYTTPSDRIPSKPNIESVIKSFYPGGTREMSDDDIFLLYYTGHGGDTGEPLLIADPTTADYGSYLTTEELNEWIKGISGKKAIILDTCHSGQVITDYPRKLDERESSLYDPHAFYLSASAAEQLSQEDYFSEIGHNHGHFSIYFLDAIGWNHISETNTEATIDGRTISVPGQLKPMEDIPSLAQGNITLTGIYKYVTEKFTFAQDWISSQTPQTGNGPLDLVLFSEHW